MAHWGQVFQLRRSQKSPEISPLLLKVHVSADEFTLLVYQCNVRVTDEESEGKRLFFFFKDTKGD